jgi:hypothetical protein
MNFQGRKICLRCGRITRTTKEKTGYFTGPSLYVVYSIVFCNEREQRGQITKLPYFPTYTKPL